MNYNQCPIMHTLEVIGGKWKPIVLHYLKAGPRRAGELMRLVPQASGKVLTEQLRELERDGIITRTVHGQVPPRVDYALSERGRTLVPVLDAMCAWGRQQRLLPNVDRPTSNIEHPIHVEVDGIEADGRVESFS